MSALAFDVYGLPAPQGGSRAVPTAQGARLITTGGKNLASWRNDFAAGAASIAADYGWTTTTAPVIVGLDFRFPMPASRSKHLRLAGRVLKTTKPDIDKLTRAALDALTAAAIFRDDAQVAILFAAKCEVHDGWTGCAVTVAELAGDRCVDGTVSIDFKGLLPVADVGAS